MAAVRKAGKKSVTGASGVKRRVQKSKTDVPEEVMFGLISEGAKGGREWGHPRRREMHVP